MMRSDVRDAISEAYPTGKLAEMNKSSVGKYRDLSTVNQILTALRRIPGVECGEWAQVDELDRALRLAIHTSSLEFWSSGEAGASIPFASRRNRLVSKTLSSPTSAASTTDLCSAQTLT